MKTIVTQEWESQKELFEHLKYIELAQLVWQTANNLSKELDWFFDANPKAKPSQVIEFINEFIEKNK